MNASSTRSQPTTSVDAFTLRGVRQSRLSFTLIELLVVIGIIAIMLVALIPALKPPTSRSLDGSTRQFLADLESARLTAIAHRTRTRVLLPITQSPITPAPAPIKDPAFRTYTVVSFDRVANQWKQLEKWTRLPESVAFNPNVAVSTTQTSILQDRQNETTPLDTSNTFTGPFIEFRPNGGTSLDPNGKFEVVALADAFVDSNGVFTAKDAKLQSQITIDPLTGSSLSK